MIQFIQPLTAEKYKNDFIFSTLVLITLELIQISVLLQPQNEKTENIIGERQNILNDFAQNAKKEIYITGISNAGILRYMLSNTNILSLCLIKNITINMLFIDCGDAYLNDKIYEFYFGRKPINDTEFDEFAKSEFNTSIEVIRCNSLFRELYNKGLLKLKTNNFSTPVSYIAYDPKEKRGEIQCQFYQYATVTSDCPSVLINKSNIKYETIRESLLNLWKDSIEFSLY